MNPEIWRELHKLNSILRDIEYCLINNRFEQAIAHLNKLYAKDVVVLLNHLRESINERIYDKLGEKE
jgi:hypothetical protein